MGVNYKLERVIDINKDMYKDMKNMPDFYVMTGVIDASYKPKINVMHIGMNFEDCEKLKDFMFANNYRKGKLRHLNKKQLKERVLWEMLYYAPCSADWLEVPHGKLYLYEGWKCE